MGVFMTTYDGRAEAEACHKKSTKSHAPKYVSFFTPVFPEERKRFYARSRQYRARQRRMERSGLEIHTRCACGCGLVIKPSAKRIYVRGHARGMGVERVVRVTVKIDFQARLEERRTIGNTK
jgi:hypothetical protein